MGGWEPRSSLKDPSLRPNWCRASKCLKRPAVGRCLQGERRDGWGKAKQERRKVFRGADWNEEMVVSPKGEYVPDDLRKQFVRPLATSTGLCHPTETRSVTTACVSVDRVLQDPAPICCLVFRGIGARHPSMTLDAGADPLGHNPLQFPDHSQKIGDTPSACTMNH